MRDDARWIRVQMWKPVREVFQAADQLFDEADRLRAAAEAEPVVAGWAMPAPRGKLAPPPGAPAAYLRQRAALREAITTSLDRMLGDALGSWQKYVCLVAITSFVDERERVMLGALADAWRLPGLQGDLLQIDDGGDRFFVQLQELLVRADVHELVFEIHLLCLRAGFVGRYRDRRPELDALLARLVERVRRDQPRRALLAVAGPPPPRRRVGFVGFPLRYYVGVGVLVVGLFAVLRVVSNREVRHSNLAEFCHYEDDDEATP